MTKETLDSIKITPLLDTLRLQKIDDAEYFSEKYAGYISNSRLSLINPEQENNPKAFFEGLGKHSQFSPALALGSAVHELTLQPELFELGPDFAKPTAKMGAMADELYSKWCDKYCVTDEEIVEASDKVDYYKGKMTIDKIRGVRDACESYWNSRNRYEQLEPPTKTQIYLDQKMLDRVKSCVEALSNNKRAQSLLHPEGIVMEPISENEQAILLDVLVEVPGHEPFTLRLKSKLDNFTIDKETNTITVNDVKTIGNILSEFNNNIERFHYSRELAMYSWLLSLCAKKYYGMENCTIKGNYLVVSTIPQYYSKVQPVTKGEFVKGFNEFKFLLKLVAYYITQGYSFE